MMHEELERYINDHFPGTKNEEWESEAIILSREETFADPSIQENYSDEIFETLLFYPCTMVNKEELYPFEISHEEKLIALGYMYEGQQHILYLANVINKL